MKIINMNEKSERNDVCDIVYSNNNYRLGQHTDRLFKMDDIQCNIFKSHRRNRL